jgi:hypothetical protein
LPVDHAEHCCYNADGEDVVGISEETDTSDENGANMVPAERRLVDLCEGEATALVGVGDVSVVVVEVVEGSIASFGSGGHSEGCGTVGCSLSVIRVKRKEGTPDTRLTLGKGLGEDTEEPSSRRVAGL